MLNSCADFGNNWNILFDLTKTERVIFGGHEPKQLLIFMHRFTFAWT